MHFRSESPAIYADVKILPKDFPAIYQDYVHTYQYKNRRLHYHNCLEIGLCTEGNGLEMINNQVYTFHANSITVIQSGCIHDSYVFKLNEHESCSKWQFIFVDLEFWGFSCREFGGFLSENPQLVALFHMMYAELTEKRTDYQSLFLNLLTAFLTYTERIAPHAISVHYTTLCPEMSHAIQFIYSNMETVSISQLARECNMSDSSFYRTFKSTFGLAPLTYINTVRFVTAEHLLRTTDMSILAISTEVGFQSLSSFNRLFKKRYGVSPTAMRKAFINRHSGEGTS